MSEQQHLQNISFMTCLLLIAISYKLTCGLQLYNLLNQVVDNLPIILGSDSVETEEYEESSSDQHERRSHMKEE